MSDEIYDDNEVHPLGVPEEIVVEPDKFFISEASNKTVEETYDILVKEFQKCGRPLLVSGKMLIDQVRLVDGTLSGRIATTGDPNGISSSEIWVSLHGHDIRTLHSDKLIEVNEQTEYFMPVFQFQCHWCGNSHTYSSIAAARKVGWLTARDPLGCDWWFCPNSDCREKLEEYREVFNQYPYK